MHDKDVFSCPNDISKSSEPFFTCPLYLKMHMHENDFPCPICDSCPYKPQVNKEVENDEI